MGASRRTLSRRSFVQAAGAALALGALTALPPRASLAGWDVSGVKDGVAGAGPDAETPAEGEGTTYAPGSFPTVEFGTYPQGANGEVEPIEWYVLDERDGRRLLLSKYVLDTRPYNMERVRVTWETCTLRTWMNTDFLKTAFSTEEQTRIAEVELENPENPDSWVPGGNVTHDRVFCLSIGEAMAYFGVGRTWQQLYGDLGDEMYGTDGYPDFEKVYAEEPASAALIAYATDFAVSRAAYVCDEPRDPYPGGTFWWLRTPGYVADYAARIDPEGTVFSYGRPVDYAYVGVRPAILLNP